MANMLATLPKTIKKIPIGKLYFLRDRMNEPTKIINCHCIFLFVNHSLFHMLTWTLQCDNQLARTQLQYFRESNKFRQIVGIISQIKSESSHDRSH